MNNQLKRFKVNANGVYIASYKGYEFVADDTVYRFAKNKYKKFMHKYRIFVLNERGKKVSIGKAHTLAQGNEIIVKYVDSKKTINEYRNEFKEKREMQKEEYKKQMEKNREDWEKLGGFGKFIKLVGICSVVVLISL